MYAARNRRRTLLVALAFAYPLFASLSPFASLNAEPRYLVLLAPVLAVLVAQVVSRRWWLAASAVALAVASSVAGLVSMGTIDPPVPPVGGLRVPADLEPVVRELDAAGETRVRAHYAVAYRIAFETKERIVASSTSQVRYAPYQRVVDADPSPSLVEVLEREWVVWIRR